MKQFKLVNGAAYEMSALDVESRNAQDAAWLEAKPSRTSLDTRNQRDRLLSETDWMALSDSPAITTDWATYRQALRDITGQSGFPYDVAWPAKPDGL
jgi:hypothetical protein